MAPEQFRGERDLDHRVDIYAVWVILYECLTGERPHLGKTPVQLADLVCEVEPRPPRELEPAVDAGLDAVCLKALAKHPDDRYGSARELAEDLERWLRRERPMALAPAATQRRALGLVLGASALLVVGAAALGLYLRGGARDQVETPAAPAGGPTPAEAKAALTEAESAFAASLQPLAPSLLQTLEAAAAVDASPALRAAVARAEGRARLAEARARAKARSPWSALEPLLSEVGDLAAGDPALGEAAQLFTARSLLRRGRAEEARRLADLLVGASAGATSLRARLFSCMAAERLGLSGAAMQGYRDVRDLDPEGPFGSLAAAALARLHEKPEEAAQAAEVALTRAPGEVDALLELGMARLRDDPDGAEVALEEARELAPDDPRVLTSIAELRLSEGKPAAAVQALETALGLLEVDQDLEAAALLGLCRARLGDTEGAHASFLAALKARSDHLPSLVHRGALLLEEGRKEEAEAAWKVAYARGSWRCRALLDRWHSAETATSFGRLVADDPRPQAEQDKEFFQLGKVDERLVRRFHSERLGDLPGPVRDDLAEAYVRAARAEPFDEIEHPVRRALRLVPKSLRGRIEQARLLLARDRLGPAGSVLGRLKGGSRAERDEIEWLEAELAWRRGDLEAALARFERAASASADRALQQAATGHAAWLRGDLEAALRAADAALEERALHLPALALRAAVLVELQRPREAMTPLGTAYERVGALDSRLLAIRAVLIKELQVGAGGADLLEEMQRMFGGGKVAQHLDVAEGSFSRRLAARLSLSSDREETRRWGFQLVSWVEVREPKAATTLLLLAQCDLARSNPARALDRLAAAQEQAPSLPIPAGTIAALEAAGQDTSRLQKR
jgi:Tfp pilus assembly protein PilF